MIKPNKQLAESSASLHGTYTEIEVQHGTYHEGRGHLCLDLFSYVFSIQGSGNLSLRIFAAHLLGIKNIIEIEVNTLGYP
jgi:hypothetical protein